MYTIDYDPLSSTCDEAIEIDYPLRSSVDEILIWGSFNGLLCITRAAKDVLCLWNPSTKEYKEIPTAPFESSNFILYFEYGFGYDCTIEDYKVVRLVGFCGIYDCCEVKVYTLGSNSWRSIQSIPCVIYEGRVHAGARLTVNGALHWIATNYMGSKAFEVILSFDVSDERFRETPLPNCLDENLETFVGVLGGALCLLDYCPVVRLDVWEMKDYGVIESWTKLFTIDQQTPVGSFKFLRPIQSFKDCEILLTKDGNAMVLYDPKHETARTHYVHGELFFFDTCIYVGSLVSLNSGTYVGQEQIEDPKEQRRSLRRKRKKTRRGSY